MPVHKTERHEATLVYIKLLYINRYSTISNMFKSRCRGTYTIRAHLANVQQRQPTQHNTNSHWARETENIQHTLHV